MDGRGAAGVDVKLSAPVFESIAAHSDRVITDRYRNLRWSVADECIIDVDVGSRGFAYYFDQTFSVDRSVARLSRVDCSVAARLLVGIPLVGTPLVVTVAVGMALGDAGAESAASTVGGAGVLGADR